MALNITNLSLNQINQHVDGNPGPFYNITDNADLNSNDVRVWGNTNGNGAYWSVTGTAGINTGSGQEISIGEFRGAEAPTTAFSGTMGALGKIVSSGQQYVPSSYYSGYGQSVVVAGGFGTHSNSTFTGTIFGVTGTHTLRALYNGGLSYNGMISFTITNPNSAYSTTATDWTSLTAGSLTLTRTTLSSVNRNATAGNAFGDNYYIAGSWGSFIAPQVLYSMSTYWTTSLTATTNVTTRFNL